MIRLTPHNGIPRQVLLMMAVMAGFTVANLYYNQPLLDLICRETGITQVEANLITVVTQIGYALGLLFVVPSADMVSVRRIVVVGMTVAAVWLFGDTYTGLIVAIILADIGAQCLQVSNQSGSLQQLPQATNRVNTIFMTTFFIGGSLGTFFSGLGWSMKGWLGVCIVGGFFASATLLLCAYEQLCMKQQNEKE